MSWYGDARWRGDPYPRPVPPPSRYYSYSEVPRPAQTVRQPEDWGRPVVKDYGHQGKVESDHDRREHAYRLSHSDVRQPVVAGVPAPNEINYSTYHRNEERDKLPRQAPVQGVPPPTGMYRDRSPLAAGTSQSSYAPKYTGHRAAVDEIPRHSIYSIGANPSSNSANQLFDAYSMSSKGGMSTAAPMKQIMQPRMYPISGPSDHALSGSKPAQSNSGPIQYFTRAEPQQSNASASHFSKRNDPSPQKLKNNPEAIRVVQRRDDPSTYKVNVVYRQLVEPQSSQGNSQSKEEDWRFCELCKIHFTEKRHWEVHCNGMLHNQKLSQQKKLAKSVEEPSTIPVQSKAVAASSPTKASLPRIFAVGIKHQNHCKICDVFNLNSKQAYEKHVGSVEHQRRYLSVQARLGFVEFKLRYYDVPFNVFDHTEESLMNDQDKFITRSGIANRLDCRLCESLCSDQANWKSHIFGKKHFQKLAEVKLKDDELLFLNYGDLFVEDEIRMRRAIDSIKTTEMEKKREEEIRMQQAIESRQPAPFIEKTRWEPREAFQLHTELQKQLIGKEVVTPQVNASRGSRSQYEKLHEDRQHGRNHPRDKQNIKNENTHKKGLHTDQDSQLRERAKAFAAESKHHDSHEKDGRHEYGRNARSPALQDYPRHEETRNAYEPRKRSVEKRQNFKSSGRRDYSDRGPPQKREEHWADKTPRQPPETFERSRSRERKHEVSSSKGWTSGGRNKIGEGYSGRTEETWSRPDDRQRLPQATSSRYYEETPRASSLERPREEWDKSAQEYYQSEELTYRHGQRRSRSYERRDRGDQMHQYHRDEHLPLDNKRVSPNGTRHMSPKERSSHYYGEEKHSATRSSKYYEDYEETMMCGDDIDIESQDYRAYHKEKWDREGRERNSRRSSFDDLSKERSRRSPYDYDKPKADYGSHRYREEELEPYSRHSTERHERSHTDYQEYEDVGRRKEHRRNDRRYEQRSATPIEYMQSLRQVEKHDVSEEIPGAREWENETGDLREFLEQSRQQEDLRYKLATQRHDADNPNAPHLLVQVEMAEEDHDYRRVVVPPSDDEDLRNQLERHRSRQRKPSPGFERDQGHGENRRFKREMGYAGDENARRKRGRYNEEKEWRTGETEQAMEIFTSTLQQFLDMVYGEHDEPIADENPLQDMSAEEREMVVQVQQMAGIRDIGIAATAMKILGAMDPVLIQTIGALGPDTISQLLQGNTDVLKSVSNYQDIVDALSSGRLDPRAMQNAMEKHWEPYSRRPRQRRQRYQGRKNYPKH